MQSDRLSGAENVAADICMMFKEEYMMSYCSPDGSIRRALSDREVDFLPVNKLSLPKIKHVIKVYKPDIIHAHDVSATILAALSAGKIPLFSHLHVNKGDMHTFTLKSFLYMIAVKKARRIIVVSEGCLSDFFFRREIESKTICLPNIIYYPRIEKLMQKDDNDYHFDFIYMGRICYQKNPQRVAKIASIVLKRCPDSTFGVIGEGELKDEMEAVFKEEGVAERVVFTGRLPYPYKALKQAKCLLICSRFEGTPIVALEAMVFGVPIISTPVDGMLDIVDNGKTGYLCSKDESLIQRVIELISDEKKQADFSMNSVERFKRLNNEERYREKLDGIYRSVFI